MVGLEIADTYAVPLLLFTVTGLFSFIAYLFRQNARSNEALATVAQQLKDIDRRTERLENRVFYGIPGIGEK